MICLSDWTSQVLVTYPVGDILKNSANENYSPKSKARGYYVTMP